MSKVSPSELNVLQAAYPNKFINELSVHYASRAIFQELVNKRFMFSHPHQEEGLVTDYALTGLGRSVVEQEAKTSEILQATTTDDRNQQAYAEFSEGWQAAEIARLQAEVARLNQIISRMIERAGLIAWAIETSKQWELFLNITDQSEPPTTALCDTLNVLISKVKDYERQNVVTVLDSEPDHK